MPSTKLAFQIVKWLSFLPTIMCFPKVISHGLPLLHIHHDPPLLHSKVITHSLPPLNYGPPIPTKVITQSLPLLHQGPSQSSKVVSHGLPLRYFSPHETLHSPLTHQLRPIPPVQSLPEVNSFSDAEHPLNHLHSFQYNDDPYEAQNYIPKHYNFIYSVQDSYSGDNYSHREKKTDYSTEGEYRVLLPDGRMQIVSYTADDDGYHASVVYQGEAVYNIQDHAIARLAGGQDHGQAEHAVPVINPPILHKSILKETEANQLSPVPHLSSSLPQIDQNPVHQPVETLASARLPVESFFPLSPPSHSPIQPHPEAPQQSEHKYRYSPTQIPYKE